MAMLRINARKLGQTILRGKSENLLAEVQFAEVGGKPHTAGQNRR